MAEGSLVEKCVSEIGFLHLHWDINQLIFHFLSPQDLGRLQCVCKSLQEIVVQCNTIWKQHCMRFWLIKVLDQSCSSWHAQWYTMAGLYGCYIECYAQVREAWDTVESHLITHHVISSDEPSFLERRSEQDISSAESKLGLSFPKDFRCSLRIHDGFSKFLGVIEFYYFKSVLCLHSLKEMIKFHRDALPDSFHSSAVTRSQYLPVGSGWPGRQTASSVLLLSLPKCKFTPPGHIVTGSIVRWMDDPVFGGHELNSGGVMDNCSVGLIGKSLPFRDWLSKEADLLKFHPVVPSPRREVNILRFYCDPKFVETTGHFTIRVGIALDPSLGLLYDSQNLQQAPMFPIEVVPMLADGGSYTYWIEITMHKDAPVEDVCQLVSRRWVIRHASGGLETVEGDGVIGQTPIFSPGDVHQYTSCTRFNNEDYSTMEGHYTMRYLRRGGTFNIRVPRFLMPKPEITWV